MKPKVILKYVPHGVDERMFYRITDSEQIRAKKVEVFGTDELDFVVMFNNRNIQRKRPGDVILAFQAFFNTLTDDQKKRVRFLMHTQPVDDNGTDIPRVIQDVTPGLPVVFSTARIESPDLNLLYNVSDAVLNIASAEGFGLGTLEAIMAERVIVVNVTGGLQDQCGFVDEAGNYLDPETHFTKEWGTNADGRYRQHGEWAFPVFPNSRSLIGSPPTPYIFDDRCSWEEAGQRLREIYDLSPEERVRRGALGREFAISMGMTADTMAANVIDGIDATLANWQPRKRFELIKV
jgi:hypothetical protein